MAPIVAIAIALIAIYVVKAATIMRGHDDLAQKSASFSWVSPEPREASAQAPWKADEAYSARRSRVATPSLRHSAGFSA